MRKSGLGLAGDEIGPRCVVRLDVVDDDVAVFAPPFVPIDVDLRLLAAQLIGGADQAMRPVNSTGAVSNRMSPNRQNARRPRRPRHRQRRWCHRQSSASRSPSAGLVEANQLRRFASTRPRHPAPRSLKRRVARSTAMGPSR